MKVDRLKNYVFEIILLILLVSCTFFISAYTKYIVSAITFLVYILSLFFVKKKLVPYTNKKQVYYIMIIFGILYVALYYVLGIYVGFYNALNRFNFLTFYAYILPITIIIVCTEKLRFKLLASNKKLSKIFVLVDTVLIDMLIYLYIYNINDFNGFINLVGYIIFSSIAGNLLYNYLSPKFGDKPIILYRLIITLYVYLIPITPNVYIFFRAFIRMIYPLLIYIHVDRNYNPDRETLNTKAAKTSYVRLACTFVLATLLIMLISCKFKYGALVIGSGSMSGAIEKGDVIIYKATNENFKKGEIIAFERDDIIIVHRIVDVSYSKGIYRYFTKGDANQMNDDGYVVKSNIKGKIVLKIKWIGRPTLWLREQFK